MFVFVLYVHSSFAIILIRKRKLVALLLLSYNCIVTINVLWCFLAVPRVGMQCLIVVFPDHTHFLEKAQPDMQVHVSAICFNLGSDHFLLLWKIF